MKGCDMSGQCDGGAKADIKADIKAAKVWLVGVGPGDPDLVTVKAARVLGEVDVWLVDDLVPAVMQRYARPGALIVPVGKRGGRCSVSQASIDAQTLAHAVAGRSVARVKGGDPLVFGRAGEEAEFLRAHGIEVEVVNGITSGVAAAQALGIALTHRAHCHGVTFVTAHTRDDGDPDWRALAAGGTTLVIYMGMRRLVAIRDALLRAGMRPDMPAGVVMHAGTAGVRHWTGTLAALGDAAAAGLCSPAIILVGDVVATAAATQALAGFSPLPLAGKRPEETPGERPEEGASSRDCDIAA